MPSAAHKTARVTGGKGLGGGTTGSEGYGEATVGSAHKIGLLLAHLRQLVLQELLRTLLEPSRCLVGASLSLL